MRLEELALPLFAQVQASKNTRYLISGMVKTLLAGIAQVEKLFLAECTHFCVKKKKSVAPGPKKTKNGNEYHQTQAST